MLFVRSRLIGGGDLVWVMGFSEENTFPFPFILMSNSFSLIWQKNSPFLSSLKSSFNSLISPLPTLKYEAQSPSRQGVLSLPWSSWSIVDGRVVVDDWNCEWYCYCMRLVLFEDLGNVNPRHEIYMCICGMRLLMFMIMLI